MIADSKYKLLCGLCDFQAKTSQGFGRHMVVTHPDVSMHDYYYRFVNTPCNSCTKVIPFNRAHWRDRVACTRHCQISKKGKEHRLWKPKQKNGEGYVLLSLEVLTPEDKMLALPMARSAGHESKHLVVLEHRFVLAKKIGRTLTRAETVHHINGRRDDNRTENLELWVGKHPPGIRAGDIECPCCGYIFDRYYGSANIR